MKTTKRNNGKRRYKNKTIKNKIIHTPSLKHLQIGFSLYASKKFEGDKLLEYKKNAEIKSGDHCLLDNSSWFGDLDVAKSYKTNDTQIYKWKIKTPTNLLRINKENEGFINDTFKNTRTQLTPAIILTDIQIGKIKYDHPYINMSPNEKALYEFKFAFGYITVQEQCDFLKMIKFLIENNIIKVGSREGSSILKKLDFKIAYYKAASFIPKKEKYNRLSFYLFDKYAIMNFCKIMYGNKKYKISGVYQKNDSSFWFPNLIVYKMNIQEYILFNPHHNLTYDKQVH